MKVYIYAHNPLSKSARALARVLHIPRIKHDSSRFVGAEHKIVINWGSHNVSDEIGKCCIINKPSDINAAANKLNFFETLDTVKNYDCIPAFTTDSKTVQYWLDKKCIVLARKLLNSSGGKGIVVMQPGDDIVAAPLYVRYIPKQEEYRVHILDNKIIDIQQKRRRHDFEEPNWRIRNLAGGFIYARQDCNAPGDVIAVALRVFKEFNLDFGAVDIIYNKNRQKAFALEINTAPGLEGQTVINYAQAIRGYLS